MSFPIRPARIARGAALALAATGLLGLTHLSPTGAVTSAPASAEPLGTTALLQSQDIGALRANVGELNQQTSDLYGARTVSACTGTLGFDSITQDKTLTSLGSRWDNSEGQVETTVTEAVAQATSPAAARRSASRTLGALRTCQHRPGAWHYGQIYHGPLVDGDHVWLDRLDRSGRATGGVAVMLQGSRLGVVEVTASQAEGGDGDDAVKNLVYLAEQRLGS